MFLELQNKLFSKFEKLFFDTGLLPCLASRKYLRIIIVSGFQTLRKNHISRKYHRLYQGNVIYRSQNNLGINVLSVVLCTDGKGFCKDKIKLP